MKNKISVIIFSILFSIIVWGTVTLSEQFFTLEHFNLKIVNLPEGYSCGLVKPESLSLKLKAKGWQLISLNLAGSKEFNLSADQDSGRIIVDPFNEINENRWINSGINVLDISPRQVNFLVEKIKFKKVKVEPEVDISFADGYGLATPVKLYPDSVLVSGPSGLLDKMSSIKNKPVEVKSIDHKTSFIAELETPLGFKLERTQVQLILDVQRIVEKSFDNIKVIIKDIPGDKDIVLIPNVIECNIRGGINILGKISPDQITASIEYRDIVYDTLGSIRPEIQIPVNTNLVYIKPEHLNYIIKKFK